MVLTYEYRIPLPFTMQEYEVAQLYMVAKYSASESSGDSGDGVEVITNEPFEEEDRKGQYTHKMYHLASKLPSWMVSLVPKNALILEEEAWNAYPRCTTVLKCPFLSKFKLVLETNHVVDRGTSENALDMDPKTLKKRHVDFIDIAMDPVENYVAEEDPTIFKSTKTGRGPLKEGWISRCEPVMCAYKCVTVDVPYWGFGSRIERFIAKNAQRKILLEGHRKCFTWIDEWHGLTMADVRRMEAETAESIRRARAMALRKLSSSFDGAHLAEEGSNERDNNEHQDRYPVSGPLQPITIEPSQIPEDLNSPRSPLNSKSNFRTSLSMRRQSASTVGPSFTMGFATISATEKTTASEIQPGRLSTSAPPRPGVSHSASSKHLKRTTSSHLHLSEDMANFARSGSMDSFPSRSLLSHLTWESDRFSDSIRFEDESQPSSEILNCMDVLERAISWAKVMKSKRDKSLTPSASRKGGAVAPVDEISEDVTVTHKVEKSSMTDIDQSLHVLESALTVVAKTSGH